MTQPSTNAHPAFTWLRSHTIPSLQIEMQEFEHKQTGAKHFHLAADNPENVFLVALRTLPMDSKGVAHILEHTALCGSEKYPVRDPFFTMIRRSLNTFMNAFTSSDCTAYPFASKNRKDFNNLLQVYLDAVFFSNLNELDFAQEGHRLAFAEDDNPNSDLQYKGVVYNEMKGAMSSPVARLWQTMSSYLFPNTTYHYNSGGEPAHIPDLSYAELQQFYKTHYHPSNAIFMTYGDIPAAELQADFESLALSRFERLPVHFSAGEEKRYLAPVRVQESYAVDPEEGSDKQTHVVMGWLLGESTDLTELYRAQLLSSVLLDNSASPLLQALETSTIGQSPSPLCGLEDNNREMSFLCGLEGCDPDAAPAVEKLVLDTLSELAENGVDPSHVESALHQLELHQREISGDSVPYGLQLLMTGLPTVVHRGDPFEVLDIEPALAQLREDIKDPQFIPGLIQRWLLSNQHRVTLTLTPDTELANREILAETSKLASIKARLSDEEKAAIVDLNKRLDERQMQEDDPSVLPKVTLDDVPAELPDIIAEDLDSQVGPLSWYAQGTNGLVYQQVVVDLPELDDELLSALPWFTTLYPELGVGEKTYAEIQSQQAAVTGGVNCFASMRSSLDDEQDMKAVLVLSSKSLLDRHRQMSELHYDSFFNVRFDEKQRIRELLNQLSARQLSNVTGRGHSLAVSAAASGMSPTARLGHEFTGLSGIRRLKQFIKSLEDDSQIDALVEKFQRIHQLVTQAPRRFLLIAEAAHRDDVIQTLEQTWQAAPAANSDQPALKLTDIRQPVREMWTTNTQVQFCAKAYPTVPGGHEDHPALCVLAGVLRNAYLHRAIREQGGAYGAGAEQDPMSASFRFYSYRDPRLEETLKDFDGSVDWMLNEELPERLVEEAILGVIGSMDRSVSPAGAAKQEYFNRLFGRTRESRMAFRKAILGVTLPDLRRVAEKYLRPENGSVAVVSNSGQAAVAEKLQLTVQPL